MRVLVLFIVVFPFCLLGQDTTLYCQQNSPTYSDCYSFFRANPTDKFGTFEHIIENSSSKVWYGKGGFVDEGKNYTLTYQQHFDTLKVNIIIDSSQFGDTVLFVNKNVIGCSDMIRYHYSTSLNNPLKYFNDVVFWFDSARQTQKSLFLYNVTWFNFDVQHPYCLPATDRLISVNIEYNPPNHVVFLTPKENEVLKKNNDGFTVKTLLGTNKKEQFVLQSLKQKPLLRPCLYLVNKK